MNEHFSTYKDNIQISKFKNEAWFCDLVRREIGKTEQQRELDYLLYKSVLDDNYEDLIKYINLGATGDHIINTYGACALFTACKKGQFQMVVELLKLNPADIERKDAFKTHKTPIAYAFDNKQAEVMKYCLALEAKNPIYYWALADTGNDSRSRRRSYGDYGWTHDNQSSSGEHALQLICNGRDDTHLRDMIKTDLNLIIDRNLVGDRNVHNSLSILKKYCDEQIGTEFMLNCLGRKYDTNDPLCWQYKCDDMQRFVASYFKDKNINVPVEIFCTKNNGTILTKVSFFHDAMQQWCKRPYVCITVLSGHIQVLV